MSALHPIMQAALPDPRIIEQATARPVVVTTEYTDGERGVRSIRVFMLRPGEVPDDPVFPDEVTSWKRELLPADRLEALPMARREHYRAQYQAWLKFKRASALGKESDQLIGFVDYDPVQIDVDTERWARGSAAYTE